MYTGDRERIREFISSEVLFGEEAAEISDDTPLLNGVIDSLGLMQLVAFLEEEYDLSIEDADMTAQHFASISAIDEFLKSKALETA